MESEAIAWFTCPVTASLCIGVLIHCEIKAPSFHKTGFYQFNAIVLVRKALTNFYSPKWWLADVYGALIYLYILSFYVWFVFRLDLLAGERMGEMIHEE